jgi:hypothetical protein
VKRFTFYDNQVNMLNPYLSFSLHSLRWRKHEIDLAILALEKYRSLHGAPEPSVPLRSARMPGRVERGAVKREPRSAQQPRFSA